MKKIVVTTMAFLSLGVASLGTKAHADETNQANTMPTSSSLGQTQSTSNIGFEESQATTISGDSQLPINYNAKTELIHKMITNQSNLPDGIYPLVYADGVFNVGFDAVIENDQFVKVQNPWHHLLLVDVVKESLSILSPKEAVYYLTVTDGQTTWNQNLHVKIFEDEFVYFFTN
ncbi:hypothetical protein B835_1997 [Enterococcus mundtii 3F]|uniref:hypothetical protein n=1 Tax=Enterococcus mundtii TaxID=53346 RepID=UPI002302C89A|nr:hypothetical protein [Enterococcus mundtii]MDA9462069.1 hypothetical protein [Enterococcus mundtii 3F]